MILLSSNGEARLLDAVKAVRGKIGPYYGLHFHTSQLQKNYRSDFQMKIAVNILNDIFRSKKGAIFLARNSDIFVVFHGDNRELLEKAIFQLRYLFVDDPLASNKDGSENEDFCTVYDLAFQWRPFHKICSEVMSSASKNALQDIKNKNDKLLLTPKRLVEIESEIDSLELSFTIRKQPICAIKNKQPIKPVFNEIYINMLHFRRLLEEDCDIFSDKWLFKHLTCSLDLCVLSLISEQPKAYLRTPISLNLNAKTIISEEFDKFTKKIEKVLKSSIVIEIGIEDVFTDMVTFLKARDLAQERGFRVCLDGLDTSSFVQIDRENLGFDLAKIRWNADMAGDLNNATNKKLAAAINKSGKGRMILCRCDSQHAIEYGHALGISLFQGRYPDRIIDPETLIVN